MTKKNLNFDDYHRVYDKIFEKYGEKFCAAPWTNTYVNTSGFASPCCKIEKMSRRMDLDKTEYPVELNSEVMKKLRRDFMEGQQPKECSHCWMREQKGSDLKTIPRVFNNFMGLDNIENALANTQGDGTLSGAHLSFLDVAWTNVCNFSCLFCSPDNSSSIEKKFYPSNTVFWGSKEFTPRQSDHDHLIDYITGPAKDTVRRIHFTGGEPFMQTKTFDLLDKMLEVGQNETVELHFNTNGSILHNYKGINIVDEYFKKWKLPVLMTMSLDHVGARGEYLRGGLSIDKWLENFRRFSDAGLQIRISTSLTVINASSVDQCFEWLEKNLNSYYKSDHHNNLTVVTTPSSLALAQVNLDEKTLNQSIKSLLNVYYSVKNYNFNLAKELKNRADLLPLLKPDASQLPNFYWGIVANDRQRGTKFLEIFPEMKSFFDMAEKYSRTSPVPKNYTKYNS